jgi:hypothetical protein
MIQGSAERRGFFLTDFDRVTLPDPQGVRAGALVDEAPARFASFYQILIRSSGFR